MLTSEITIVAKPDRYGNGTKYGWYIVENRKAIAESPVVYSSPHTAKRALDRYLHDMLNAMSIYPKPTKGHAKILTIEYKGVVK